MLLLGALLVASMWSTWSNPTDLVRLWMSSTVSLQVKKKHKKSPSNYTLLGTWRQRYDNKGLPLSLQGSLARTKGCGSRPGRSICTQTISNHSEARLDPTDPSYVLWSGDDPVAKSAIIDYSFQPRLHNNSKHSASGAASDPACEAICRQKVKDKQCWTMMSSAMGRLGNRLSEMMHALLLTKITGVVPGLELQRGFISVIWDFPQYLCVGRPQDFPSTPRVVNYCLGHANRGQEYDSPCNGDLSRRYVELARQYLVPYFSKSMKECLAAPRDLDEDELLTIHLRGDDIFGIHVEAGDYDEENFWLHAAPGRMTEQPPCSFYKKLINDRNFARVLIITSQDLANPCVEWLNMHRTNLTNSKGELVKMELQTGSLEQDACAILKARQIAPSHSSLLHNLIVVAAATHPVTVFLSRRAAFDAHWLLACSASAANVTFHFYDGTHTMKGPTNPISGLPVPHTLKAALDWLVNFPEGSLKALTPEEQHC